MDYVVTLFFTFLFLFLSVNCLHEKVVLFSWGFIEDLSSEFSDWSVIKKSNNFHSWPNYWEKYLDFFFYFFLYLKKNCLRLINPLLTSDNNSFNLVTSKKIYLFLLIIFFQKLFWLLKLFISVFSLYLKKVPPNADTFSFLLLSICMLISSYYTYPPLF